MAQRIAQGAMSISQANKDREVGPGAAALGAALRRWACGAAAALGALLGETPVWLWVMLRAWGFALLPLQGRLSHGSFVASGRGRPGWRLGNGSSSKEG